MLQGSWSWTYISIFFAWHFEATQGCSISHTASITNPPRSETPQCPTHRRVRLSGVYPISCWTQQSPTHRGVNTVKSNSTVSNTPRSRTQKCLLSTHCAVWLSGVEHTAQFDSTESNPPYRLTQRCPTHHTGLFGVVLHTCGVNTVELDSALSNPYRR